MRELLKRSLVWAIPLEFVAFWIAIVGDEVRSTTGTDPLSIRLAQGLHFPAYPYGPQGNPLVFVLNGYLVLLVLLMLATSAYRAIALWLTRP